MSDPLDETQNERQVLEEVRAIAAGIFARYGVDFAAARRAGGWSNATWIAGGLVLRIAVRPGNETIRGEVRLSALLPAEVGYPRSIECGETGGYEWNLSREIPGHCLGEVWDSLSWAERSAALPQIWDIMQAVHAADPDAARMLARQRAWYNSNDATEAEAGLVRLTAQGILSPTQAGNLRAALARFWKAIPQAACVLNHGDMTLDNMIWHAGQVVSLLDFEFAVFAPPEMDINSFLKHAFGPDETGNLLPDEDEAGQERLRQTAARLARPALVHPASRDRLLGYAILIELFMLELWLAHPEGEDPQIENWAPYRRLISLADGQGGYLGPLLRS